MSKALLKIVLPIALIVVLAIGLPLTSGCMGKPATAPPATAPPEEVEPILVGMPLPLSGPNAADGEEMRRAAIMAFEDVNAKGGLLGRPIEWIVYDVVDWSAEYQVAARDYLMGKGVDVFLYGYGLDPSAIDIFAADEVNGIPYIGCSVTELFVDLRLKNPDKYWNQVDLADTAICYGPNAYDVLAGAIPKSYEYPSKTVAILTSEITYNTEISDAFRKLIQENPEWEVVVDEVHPFGALDYGVQLAKIRETNPGLIFFSTVNIPEAVAFVRQFLEDPTDSLLFIQFAPTLSEFREMLGDQSVGILSQAQPSYTPTREMAEFTEKYIERWGEEPGLCLPYYNYDTVMSWVAAVEAVGDVNDTRGILDYIRHTHIPGMTRGPGGLWYVPQLEIARTPRSPSKPERFPGERPGLEYMPIPTFQIQMTSDGPKNIEIFLESMPVWDYMEKYYGYPPQEKYIQELGKAEFELPPWLE